MSLDLRRTIQAWTKAGNALAGESERLQLAMARATMENPWFTPANIRRSLQAWAEQLQEKNLEQWLRRENIAEVATEPKTVALIMAGNIPLVGLHDLLSVLITGHKALLKLSSEDSALMNFVIGELMEYYPELSSHIRIADDRLSGFHAAIATGSNNSSRYFQHYFGKYPHIIRKNRNSIAVLTEDATAEEMRTLGDDVFAYFGKGCRNVTQLLVPEGFDITRVLDEWQDRSELINNHRYANNYTYHKAILLMNHAEHLDNDFLLIQKSAQVYAPVSMLHYDFYTGKSDLEQRLAREKENIQCVVGRAYIPFGKAQEPALWDYADEVNTIQFLKQL